MTNPILSLNNVECAYNHQHVVRGITLQLEEGDIACLVGPSGCGKTTTLRAIAGLEPLVGGSIRIHGEDASTKGWTLPPEKRRLGMVFQEHALFPHLNVAANIAFALRHLPRQRRRERVSECLKTVQLSGMEERYPHELSGGQQQRVALARALAPEPRLILLDEPFASLDLDLRRQLNRELREILRSSGISAVMVTHDLEEAFAMASQVAVMRDGQLMQWDTPYRIYHAPLSRFVAEFAGAGAFIRGVVQPGNRVCTGAGVLQSRHPLGLAAGTQADVLLRPEDVVADPQGDLDVEVTERLFTGPSILYRLSIRETGETLICVTDSHVDVAVGDILKVRIAAKHLVLFPVEAQPHQST